MDEAVARFVAAYAGQTDCDYKAFAKAAQGGADSRGRDRELTGPRWWISTK